MRMADLKQKIGEDFGVSNWVEIGQDRIDAFADTTEDHQFIHVDPERAKDTPFGQTIAHGFLTLSLLVKFLSTGVPEIEDQTTLINYGLGKVRFLAPVKSGSKVRGRFKLIELEEKRPGQWQETLEVTVEIDGEDKPAMIAEWILLSITE